MMKETWYGLVQTPGDAYLLLEACRVGVLHRITRRLTDLERAQVIRPGAVFVWEEKEAGIKRWTDHYKWSPSRVSGAFLIYSELLPAHIHPQNTRANEIPLLKQSFSSTTLQGDRLHLIAYYSKTVLDAGTLPTPADDERLLGLSVPTGIYPDHRALNFGAEPRPTTTSSSSSPSIQRTVPLPRSGEGSRSPGSGPMSMQQPRDLSESSAMSYPSGRLAAPLQSVYGGGPGAGGPEDVAAQGAYRHASAAAYGLPTMSSQTPHSYPGRWDSPQGFYGLTGPGSGGLEGVGEPRWEPLDQGERAGLATYPPSTGSFGGNWAGSAVSKTPASPPALGPGEYASGSDSRPPSIGSTGAPGQSLPSLGSWTTGPGGGIPGRTEKDRRTGSGGIVGAPGYGFHPYARPASGGGSRPERLAAGGSSGPSPIDRPASRGPHQPVYGSNFGPLAYPNLRSYTSSPSLQTGYAPSERGPMPTGGDQPLPTLSSAALHHAPGADHDPGSGAPPAQGARGYPGGQTRTSQARPGGVMND